MIGCAGRRGCCGRCRCGCRVGCPSQVGRGGVPVVTSGGCGVESRQVLVGRVLLFERLFIRDPVENPTDILE